VSDLAAIGFPLTNQLSQPLTTTQSGILPEAYSKFTEVSLEEEDLKGRQLLDIVWCTPIDG